MPVTDDLMDRLAALPEDERRATITRITPERQAEIRAYMPTWRSKRGRTTTAAPPAVPQQAAPPSLAATSQVASTPYAGSPTESWLGKLVKPIQRPDDPYVQTRREDIERMAGKATLGGIHALPQAIKGKVFAGQSARATQSPEAEQALQGIMGELSRPPSTSVVEMAQRASGLPWPAIPGSTPPEMAMTLGDVASPVMAKGLEAGARGAGGLAAVGLAGSRFAGTSLLESRRTMEASLPSGLPEEERLRRVREMEIPALGQLAGVVEGIKAGGKAIFDPSRPDLPEAFKKMTATYGEVHPQFNVEAGLAPGTRTVESTVPMKALSYLPFMGDIAKTKTIIDPETHEMRPVTRMTPEGGAAMGFGASMVADPMARLMPPVVKGAAQLAGAGGRALARASPAVAALERQFSGTPAYLRQATETASAAGVLPKIMPTADTAKMLATAFRQREPRTVMWFNRFQNEVLPEVQKVQPAELETFWKAVDATGPRAQAAFDSLTPPAQQAAQKLQGLMQDMGREGSALYGLNLRDQYLHHGIVSDLLEHVERFGYAKPRDLPARLYLASMEDPAWKRRAKLEMLDPGQIERAQSKYLGSSPAVRQLKAASAQEPAAPGWEALADPSRAGIAFRKAMEASPQAKYERAMSSAVQGPLPEPIQTVPEVNKALGMPWASAEAQGIQRKFPLWEGPGKPLFETDPGKATAARVALGAPDIESARALKAAEPLVARIPATMPVQPGYRPLSDLGASLPYKTWGIKDPHTAAIPEPLFEMLSNEMAANPKGAMAKVGDQAARVWATTMTAAGGPGYHVRNMTTSAYTIIDEYGVLGGPLALTGGLDIFRGRGASVAGVPMEQIRLAMQQEGALGGTGKSVASAAHEMKRRAGIRESGIKGAAKRFVSPEESPLARAGGRLAGDADELARATVVAGELNRGVPLEQAIARAMELIPQTQHLSPVLAAIRKVAPFAPWSFRAAPVFARQLASGRGALPLKIQSAAQQATPETAQVAEEDIDPRASWFSPTPTGAMSEIGKPLYWTQSGAPTQAMQIAEPLAALAPSYPKSVGKAVQDLALSQALPWLSAPLQAMTGKEAYSGKPLDMPAKADPWAMLAGQVGQVLGAEPSESIYPTKPGAPGEMWKQEGLWRLLTKALPYQAALRVAQAKTPEEFGLALGRALGVSIGPVIPEFERARRMREAVKAAEDVRAKGAASKNY